MSDVTAWPFLVSCNMALDYRTVVAPDFIYEAGVSRNLARAAGGSLTPQGQAYYREVHDSAVGKIALLFRVVEATSEHLDKRKGDALRDEFGRVVFLIEGLVLRDHPGGKMPTGDDLDAAHAILIKEFKEFWDSESWASRPSAPITLAPDTADATPLILIRQQAFISEHAPKSEPGVVREKRRQTTWREINLDSERKEHRDVIISLDFSPDSKLLISRSYDHTLYLRDASEGRLLNFFFVKQVKSRSRCSIAFNPHDSSQVVTGVYDSDAQFRDHRFVVSLLNLENNTSKALSGHDSPVVYAAFNPGGKSFLSIDENNTVIKWERGWLMDESYSPKVEVSLNYNVTALAISPQKHVRATGDDRGQIRIYESGLDKQFIKKQGHLAQVTSLAFTPNGSHIVSASKDKEIAVWDAHSGNEVLRISKHGLLVQALSISSEAGVLVSGDVGGHIKVWSIETWEELSSLKTQNSSLTALSISPNGRTIAAALDDNRIQLWSRPD